MKTTRTTLLTILLVVLLATVATAAPVSIRISGWSAGPEIEALMREQLDAFEALHPDIKVRYEPIPVDYLTKIQVMLAAKNAPDVFFVDAVYAPQFMATGALLPLDDLMGKTGTDPDMYAPALLDAFRYDGHIYGIPKDFNTMVLYYNKAIFDEAGVEYPTRDWTWEDLENAATQLTKTEGRAVDNVYGLVLGKWPPRWLSLVYQNGGKVINEDGSLAITEPAFVEAFKFYTDLHKKGIAVMPSDVGTTRERDAFGQGRVAMAMEGGWAIPTLFSNYPDLDWSAVELPMGPEGRGNISFTVSYSIPKTTKHPEAAWQLIQYLSGHENQIRILESGHVLPSITELFDHPHFDDATESRAVMAGVPYSKPNQYGRYSQQVIDEVEKAFDAVVVGNIEPEEALKKAEADLKKVMK